MWVDLSVGADWLTQEVSTVGVHSGMPALSRIVTLGLCPLPQPGRLSAPWRLVPSAWQPVSVLWWCFFLQEMVSDWEQCVNSPVTLDKPARRPVTGTYGMFDRERGCESHWMIKWCFSPFGNVMLSGKRVDHRSLKRLTPASLWHLLQGPGFLCLAPGQFWHDGPMLLTAAPLTCRCGEHNWISV